MKYHDILMLVYLFVYIDIIASALIFVKKNNKSTTEIDILWCCGCDILYSNLIVTVFSRESVVLVEMISFPL